MDIESIKKMHIEPGDLLVLKSKEHLTKEQYERLKHDFEKNINFKECKILILDNGLDLDVYNVDELLKKITPPPEPWVDMKPWDKCKDDYGDFSGRRSDLNNLIGRPCYAGLNLTSSINTASLVLVFPEDNFKVVSLFFIPEETFHKSVYKDIPVRWIEKTPGSRINYGIIRQCILDVCGIVTMRAIAYDPYSAHHMAEGLKENHNIPMVSLRHGYQSMSAPTLALQNHITEGTINHGGNPVLRIHALNAVIKQDPAKNIKIDQEESLGDVDGIVALTMALCVQMLNYEVLDGGN